MAARMVSVAIGEGVAGLKGTRSQRSRVAAVRAASTAEPVGEATSSKVSSVSIEYQRQRAKEMTKYFNSLKFEKTVADQQVFGWTRKNEIGNGRWVMMGIAIGLLTELATGVSFPQQLALMVSYLGIADIYD